LTRLDPLASTRLGEVGPGEKTHRRALARGKVFMAGETTAMVARGSTTKGDVLAVARVAGMQAAKRTAELLPLCRQTLLGSIFLNFRIEDSWIEVEAQVETFDRTGVEMEAITACTVACLTIYDMVKSSDRSVSVGEVALWEKTGGRSGAYRRDPDGALPGAAPEPVDGVERLSLPSDSLGDDPLGLG
jgi:cyclic pyranopterin phosphate synthase